MNEPTDRELLELAAKAAGWNISETPFGQWRRDEKYWWDPLTDDGDALRLAVKLRLDICTDENDAHPTEDRQIRHVNVWAFGGGSG